GAPARAAAQGRRGLLPERTGRRGRVRRRGRGCARVVVRRARLPRRRLRRDPARNPAPLAARQGPAPPARDREPRVPPPPEPLPQRARPAHRDGALQRARHPPARAAQAARRDGRLHGARQERQPAGRDGAAAPPLRRRRLGRLLLSVGAQHPRLRAARGARAPAAAVSPDLRGRRLRDLLVLPAAVRLRAGRRVGALQPPERDVGRGAVLRERRVHEPQGHRARLDHAPPRRPAARPAARQDGGIDRRQGHDRAGGDDRHLPAAADRARSARARGRDVPALVAAAVVVTPAAARALLAGLVDYAGLFPPAALGMEAAVAEYARWRRAPEAFMLGRFIAPAGRLVELGRAAETLLPEPGAGEPWHLSALLGADLHGDGARVASWNLSHSGRATVDSVGLKAASPQEARPRPGAVPPGPAAFVALPLPSALPALLAVLKQRGARAKLRTGGVVPEAIPEPGDVARFIVACAAAGVAFKTTARLPHPG